MNNSTFIIIIIGNIGKLFTVIIFIPFFALERSIWIGTDNLIQVFPSKWMLQSIVLEEIGAFGLTNFILWIQIERRFISSLLEPPGRQCSEILVPFSRNLTVWGKNTVSLPTTTYLVFHNDLKNFKFCIKL